MPVGKPTPQTIATKKYEKKAGWMSKSYKIKREVVEEFARACEEEGVSQASQLTKMMKEFVEKRNSQGFPGYFSYKNFIRTYSKAIHSGQDTFFPSQYCVRIGCLTFGRDR